MTEQEVLDALNAERQGAKRASILERLHMRYNTLRVSRERIEIMKEAVAPWLILILKVGRMTT